MQFLLGSARSGGRLVDVPAHRIPPNSALTSTFTANRSEWRTIEKGFAKNHLERGAMSPGVGRYVRFKALVPPSALALPATYDTPHARSLSGTRTSGRSGLPYISWDTGRSLNTSYLWDSLYRWPRNFLLVTLCSNLHCSLVNTRTVTCC